MKKAKPPINDALDGIGKFIEENVDIPKVASKVYEKNRQSKEKHERPHDDGRVYGDLK